MNVQIKINDLVYLLDSNMLIEQVAKAVKSQAEKSGILMPAPEIGSGYMVWRLPGDGWVSFDNLSDDEKSLCASAVLERIEKLKSLIGQPELASKITRIPDTKYVYVRNNNGIEEYALVAWAYRYPENRAGRELETWIKRTKKQEVSLGFAWDDKLMPDQSFTIQNISHKTQANGLFFVGAVPVGSAYTIVHQPTGNAYSLDVEIGKDRYVWDLTRYFNVEVTVSKDGQPITGESITVAFDGKTQTIATDSTGKATLTLPMAGDGMGSQAASQPTCTVDCRDKSIAKVPNGENCILSYNFEFNSDPEPLPEPTPPEFVTIELHDVLGTKIANMPICLTTKKKKKIALTTDADGKCVVPKEWFTPGEKMHISFVMTQDYHDEHGIELDLKKRNKTKK